MSQPVAAKARIVTQCAKARYAPRAISARHSRASVPARMFQAALPRSQAGCWRSRRMGWRFLAVPFRQAESSKTEAKSRGRKCRLAQYPLGHHATDRVAKQAAEIAHREARRDIWCKFVEIFIHFSICTLCKGIASAAKATGLTEVGIVFQQRADKGAE